MIVPPQPSPRPLPGTASSSAHGVSSQHFFYYYYYYYYYYQRSSSLERPHREPSQLPPAFRTSARLPLTRPPRCWRVRESSAVARMASPVTPPSLRSLWTSCVAASEVAPCLWKTMKTTRKLFFGCLPHFRPRPWWIDRQCVRRLGAAQTSAAEDETYAAESCPVVSRECRATYCSHWHRPRSKHPTRTPTKKRITMLPYLPNSARPQGRGVVGHRE